MREIIFEGDEFRILEDGKKIYYGHLHKTPDGKAWNVFYLGLRSPNLLKLLGFNTTTEFFGCLGKIVTVENRDYFPFVKKKEDLMYALEVMVTGLEDLFE